MSNYRILSIFMLSIFCITPALFAQSNRSTPEVVAQFPLPGYGQPNFQLKKNSINASSPATATHTAKVVQSGYGVVEIHIYDRNTWLRRIPLGKNIAAVSKVTLLGGRKGRDIQIDYTEFDDTTAVIPVKAVYSGSIPLAMMRPE